MEVRRISIGSVDWTEHTLGAPNRGTMAAYEIGGHVFTLGRYNQYADKAILSITRHLVVGAERVAASAALAALRRQVRRDFPGILALQTYTDGAHSGVSYRADGWVYVMCRRGQKRWVRSCS